MELPMRLCNCASCGMSFAMPEAVAKRLENCHNTFYCPAGHSNFYPQKSDVEIWRDRFSQKNDEVNRLQSIISNMQKKPRKTKKKHAS